MNGINEEIEDAPQKPKKRAKKTNIIDYLDDYVITKDLIRECNEYKAGERKSPSEELAKSFLVIFKHFISSWKYYRYTPDRKQDYLSQSSFLFMKNWFKFDATRVQKNYKQVNGEKFLVDESEFRGAFSFFTMICANGTHAQIAKHKKQKERMDELKAEQNRLTKEDLTYEML